MLIQATVSSPVADDDFRELGRRARREVGDDYRQDGVQDRAHDRQDDPQRQQPGPMTVIRIATGGR